MAAPYRWKTSWESVDIRPNGYLLGSYRIATARAAAYPGLSGPSLRKCVMMASSTTRSVANSSRMSRTSCSVGMLSLSAYFFWSAATACWRSAAAFIRLPRSGSPPSGPELQVRPQSAPEHPRLAPHDAIAEHLDRAELDVRGGVPGDHGEPVVQVARPLVAEPLHPADRSP